MTTRTPTQTAPDPGPGYRLLQPGPGYRLLQDDEVICLGDERMDGVDYPPRSWLNVNSGIGMTVADYRSGYPRLSIMAVRRKIEAPAPHPEQPAPPTPVAPTKPGLYPLADGSTVWLVGPDYAGDWVGMWGDCARCWRHDGSGRAVPAVTGPRIPEPIDDEAAIARVNHMIAAGKVEWLSRDGQRYIVAKYMQFRIMPATITTPPADWPQEMRDAAIEQAQKRGLEVAK